MARDCYRIERRNGRLIARNYQIFGFWELKPGLEIGVLGTTRNPWPQEGGITGLEEPLTFKNCFFKGGLNFGSIVWDPKFWVGLFKNLTFHKIFGVQKNIRVFENLGAIGTTGLTGFNTKGLFLKGYGGIYVPTRKRRF